MGVRADSVMGTGVEFRKGVRAIDRQEVGRAIDAARSGGLPVFVLEMDERVGREAFFDAVKAVLPHDPPLTSSRSWDALSDSVWEGVRNLEARRIVIIWPDATRFRDDASADYLVSMEVLADLVDSLGDSVATTGMPKEVCIIVGMAFSDDFGPP